MAENPNPIPPQQHFDPDSAPRPQETKEEVYYEGRPMLRGELGQAALWTLLGLALIAAPILISTLADTSMPWWSWVVFIALGIVAILMPHLLVRRTYYRVTNYRINFERGLLSRHIDTLELWHVDDVKFYQGLLDRMFGVGDITIYSSDKTTPKLDLEGIREPRKLFDVLQQRIIAVKRERGVIKMDMG